MAQVKVPGGDHKGKAIEDPTVPVDTLNYWANRIAKDLEQNPTKQFADQDRINVAAMRGEVARRGGAPAQSQQRPAAQQQRAPSTAVVQAPVQALVGSYGAATMVDAKLREAASQFHLVSPATSCGSLPEGCEVALSLVHVDPSTDKSGPGDVAPVGGGKLSLSGSVLKKIGAAAGIDWDPVMSGRLDNGKNPHYCHFRAVGTVRLFDGRVRTVTGEVEIDMREGSPQIVAMQQRAKEGANLDSQIRDTRLFLLRHAETKAKLRAIADMGVKRSYTAKELEKPFAVARIMFTGKTQDPELRRMFASKIADSMLGGSRALYGGQAPALSGPAPTPQLIGHEAPPHFAPADDEALTSYGEEVTRTPLPHAPPANPGDAYEPPTGTDASY